MPLSDDIQSIKTKAYISVGFSIFGIVPVIGLLFTIIGFIIKLLVVIEINSKSKSKILLVNYVRYIITSFLGSIVTLIGGLFGFAAALSSGSGDESIFAGLGIAVLIGLFIIIIALIFAWFYFSELRRITEEPFFIYAYIALVIALITYFIPIWNFLALLVAGIIEIIAWVRFKKIKRVS